MHVYGVVFEGVFEAGLFDWAGFADLSCCLDVGDVFVFFGEHEVCFASASCVFLPSVWFVWVVGVHVCIVIFWLWFWWFVLGICGGLWFGFGCGMGVLCWGRIGLRWRLL